jgi:hypothetical protein
MFNLFGRKTAKDFMDEAKETYTLPKETKIKPKEHYRVGFDDEGMTTLTLMADGGSTMTLSMSQEASEQLIKLLRATYKDQQSTEESNV